MKKIIPITRRRKKLSKIKSQPFSCIVKKNQKNANFSKSMCTHTQNKNTLYQKKCLKVKAAHFDKKKTNLIPTQLDPDAQINKK